MTILDDIVKPIKDAFEFVIGMGKMFFDFVKFVFESIPKLLQILVKMGQLLLYGLELIGNYAKIPFIFISLIPLFFLLFNWVNIINAIF